ncbi:hypothetical protein Tco_0748581 [Tanacetum coccineum]|uniref:Uncharacterized protein n=1 Tax=Tanacetum coccineum TaxID=301880 RepID=A0ABQ4YWY5_9ASTR
MPAKTMNEAQAHTLTTEKELLPLVYAFEIFGHISFCQELCSVYTSFCYKRIYCKKLLKARLMRGSFCSMNSMLRSRQNKGAGKSLPADHALLRLEYTLHQNEFKNKEITKTFPLETLGSVALRDDNTPWFSDFANYHAGNFIVKGMSS